MRYVIVIAVTWEEQEGDAVNTFYNIFIMCLYEAKNIGENKG